ncbi:DNA-directed RNA polymerase I subunit RPA43 [Linepithema humile]|uniref:DNA-directed RNA polymerase I subunit RPA43 n=1 Tax=Linepithema humile TaxID=83485 RepID=UPI000623B720|nr:PREDICTED: DNA-directed RNA polymerase I subunit RPA43 [Linepithema humile]XP_012218211.1 PREDICTED: DNA-directed RNA polymerase I subunit RPA43 [Linepithema humile]
MDAQTNQVTWDFLELGELLEEEYAHVHFERTIKHMALHPYHLNNVQRGVNQILKSSLNNYDKELKGFLLAFKNPGLLAINEVFYDSPFIHIDVEADFYLFRPTVGSFLKGIVNKKGLDHIVVLVHKTYTVSIPKPDDTEEWLGDMVEIGQEVKCYIRQIDNISKPPFICGILNSDYSQGCRLLDSTINITDVVDTTVTTDTTENYNLNIESYKDIKTENANLSDFGVTEPERKKKKKHTKKSKILYHTMSDSEPDCGIKIKIENPDPVEDWIINEKSENQIFNDHNELVQNGNLELHENHKISLKIESNKSLKRESSVPLDNISETEKKKKKKHVKKRDPDAEFTIDNKELTFNKIENTVFNIKCEEKQRKDRKDGILEADLSASISEVTISKKHKKSMKRLKSESEVEDYVPVKVKIEKPDVYIDE